MKTTDDFDLRADELGLRLSAWMATTAPTREPAGLVAGAVGRTGSVRQRPAFLVRAGLPGGRLGGWSQGSVRRLVVIGLVALSLLAVAGALVVALGRPTSTVAPEVEAATLRTVIQLSGTVDINGDAVDSRAGLLDDRTLLVVGWSASVVDIATGQMRPVSAGYQPGSPYHVVRLQDGRMLVASYAYDQSADRYLIQVYDPRRDAFTLADDLTARRTAPGVVTLADGRVLLAGGNQAGSGTPVATAEIFDPKTGAFTPTGGMRRARFNPKLTLLEGGRVLVVGGCDPDCSVDSAEVYDPATGRFEATGEMVGRAHPFRGETVSWASPVRLADGRVLVFGVQIEPRGCTRTLGIKPIAAEIYDPTTGTFAAAPPLPHQISTATLLTDGRVLVAGSWHAVFPRAQDATTVLDPAEAWLVDSCDGPRSTLTDPWIGIYDPTTGVVHESRNPITGESSLAVDSDREYTSSVTLDDGRVLLFGRQTDTAIKPIVVNQGSSGTDGPREGSGFVVDVFGASASP
jgi:hypothetical protein